MREIPAEPEQAIVDSWHVNAAPWAAAVAAQSIASRRLVTNQAVVDAVRAVRPRRVLDVGCGEGWLARTLHSFGIDVLGIDVVPALVARAHALGGGEFKVMSYQDLATSRLDGATFDAAVCNFSLLGHDSVEGLLGTLGRLPGEQRSLIVQTLHPVAACGAQPYRDGWRAGSWAGFGPEFSAPAPWYFRTLSSWYAMLRRTGFEVLECREPAAPGAAAPASLLFICERRTTAIKYEK
jgi:SAM-dependent methyltransferase